MWELGITENQGATKQKTSRNRSQTKVEQRQTNAETNRSAFEAINARSQSSIVTISASGRSGSAGGVGTGFVLEDSALVATCLHVIGEGRALSIQGSDGRPLQFIEVYAWDRKLDLAILKVSALPKGIKGLPLGNSDLTPQGSPVIALGNPMGLRHSVVEGVISARREHNGIEMQQLAIPVEPGNSGGPVIDAQGQVVGIISMKSAMTANLGFAIPVNQLKTLISKPNKVPMARWLQLGGLNTNQWTQLMGAQWIQKPGRIEVSGMGNGFGGRTLCLNNTAEQTLPYEVSVEVKLGTEQGAAGLVFASDQGEKHYGFYPSAGQLRLTRFDGPTVFNWNILQQAPSSSYRPGDFNEIRVRHEQGIIKCFVNGEQIFETKDEGLSPGKLGLVAFRETPASFKNFRFAKELPNSLNLKSTQIDQWLSSLETKMEEIQEGEFPVLDGKGMPGPSEITSALVNRATKLETEAKSLRILAERAHHARVQSELASLLNNPTGKLDLFQGALMVAKLEYPDLNSEAYLEEINRMAEEVARKFPPSPSSAQKLKTLDHYLFQENGFHGSRIDYYDKANSYIHNVMEDREGIPITLSILYLELARQIGITNIVGIPLPGHFLLKELKEDGRHRLIDVFDSARELTTSEADEMGSNHLGEPVRSEYLPAASNRDIIVRMLRNLHAITAETDSSTTSLRFLDTILAIHPSSSQDRMARAQLRLRRGLITQAQSDLKWILEKAPPGVDLDRVAELYRSLRP